MFWMVGLKISAQEPLVKNYPITSGLDFFQSVAQTPSYVVVGQPNRTVVGGIGRVLVFDAKTRVLVREITSAGSVFFGYSVVVLGNELYVGEPNYSVGSNPGKVHVFDLKTGALKFFMVPTNDSVGASRAGEALAVNESFIFIGAPNDDGGKGAVFVFGRTTGTQQGAKITGAGSAANANFGATLAVSGGVLIVGAPGYSSQAGRFFTYDAVTKTAITPNISPNSAPNQQFAAQVAMSGRKAIINEPEASSSQGVIHMFDAIESAGHRESILPYSSGANQRLGKASPSVVISWWHPRMFRTIAWSSVM